MKRISLLLLALGVITSCGKTQPEAKMVSVTFDFALPESGSMTRATAAEVYDTFYESYIKTRELLPTQYTLSFKTMDGVSVASISGDWSSNKPVMLSTGKYQVTGSSKGHVTYNDYYHRAPLIFDEVIEINENTSSITLHAIYDCFLLLFDAEGKTYFRWSADGSANSGTSGDVNKAGNWYYIFVQKFEANGSVRWNYGGKRKLYLNGELQFPKRLLLLLQRPGRVF